MYQAIRFFLLVLMVSTATKPALARCIAKTCTEAYNACTGVHCFAVRARKCQRYCRMQYEMCLQTGEFHGQICQNIGLIRK